MTVAPGCCICVQAGALAYMPIILRSGGITPPHVADLAMIIGLSKLMSTAVAMSLVHGKVGLYFQVCPTELEV